MHTEIDPIISPNPLMGWSLFRRFLLLWVLYWYKWSRDQSWRRRHSWVASVIRSSLGSSYQMSWAHKSCVLCQSPEAEAGKTQPCILLIITWSWGRQLPRLHPAQGRQRHRALWREHWTLRTSVVISDAGCSLLTPERGVATSEWSNIQNVQYSYWVKKRDDQGWNHIHESLNEFSPVSWPAGWDTFLQKVLFWPKCVMNQDRMSVMISIICVCCTSNCPGGEFLRWRLAVLEASQHY